MSDPNSSTGSKLGLPSPVGDSKLPPIPLLPPMDHPLQGLFMDGETVGDEQVVNGAGICRITVTNWRCFLWNLEADCIQEFPRAQLTSIDYTRQLWWPLGILSILLGMAAVIALQWFPQGGGLRFPAWCIVLALVTCGIMLLFRITETLQFWVAGRNGPLKISRHGYVFPRSDRLVQLIRKIRAMTRIEEHSR